MKDAFFKPLNLAIVLIGVGLLLAGFWALSQGPVNGSLTMNVAPVLLTIAYVVVLPLGFILGGSRKKQDSGD